VQVTVTELVWVEGREPAVVVWVRSIPVGAVGQVKEASPEADSFEAVSAIV
jgi:hypothetical protein